MAEPKNISIIRRIFYIFLFCTLYITSILAVAATATYLFPRIDAQRNEHKNVAEVVLFLPKEQLLVYHNADTLETPGCVEVKIKNGPHVKHCGDYQLILDTGQ